MASSLSFVRLVADTAGESHFGVQHVDIVTSSFAPPAPPFGVSAMTPASECGFLQVPRGWVGELHPSPSRMWVFLLSGTMEFETSDGERRCIAPGTAMLLEDTAGKGHLSRVVGDTDAVFAIVKL